MESTPDSTKAPVHPRWSLRAWICKVREFNAWVSQAFVRSLMNYLRAWPILKLFIVRASVKWPFSKWDVEVGYVITWRKFWLDKSKEWKLNGLGSHKPRAWSFDIPKRLWRRRLWFWGRACYNRSTWDPTMCYLCIVCPLITCVKLLSWKPKWKVDSSEEASVKWEGSSLHALNLSSYLV